MEEIEELMKLLRRQDRFIQEKVVLSALLFAPDSTIEIRSAQNDYPALIGEYLQSNLKRQSAVVGKLLYIRSAFDFFTFKYGDIDHYIEVKARHERWLADSTDDLKEVYVVSNERVDEHFPLEKDFRNEWIEYRENYLTDEKLDILLLKLGL